MDGYDLIRLEILQFSYFEHFKAAKDLAMVLPLGHPRRVEIEKSCAETLAEIHKIKGTQNTQ
jgi:aminoglycoside phosphotransferase (APT) family kinase protein